MNGMQGKPGCTYCTDQAVAPANHEFTAMPVTCTVSPQDTAWQAASHLVNQRVHMTDSLPAHLLILCSFVKVGGSKEEGVQVAACPLTARLARLHQPPCQLQKAGEQALQCALHGSESQAAESSDGASHSVVPSCDGSWHGYLCV